MYLSIATVESLFPWEVGQRGYLVSNTLVFTALYSNSHRSKERILRAPEQVAVYSYV
jgi:hypothetical protein